MFYRKWEILIICNSLNENNRVVVKSQLFWIFIVILVCILLVRITRVIFHMTVGLKRFYCSVGIVSIITGVGFDQSNWQVSGF